MTKKILLTTPTFPPHNSGLGNTVQQLAKFIGEQGWEVVVATSGSTRSQYRDELSSALVEQFNVGGADSIAQPLRGDVDSYVSYLKGSQFDIIFMNAWQTWSTDLVLSHCKAVHGKKLLYSHCISTNSIIGKLTVRSVIRYLSWRPYWWAMRDKMQLLDGIIFLAANGCDARFDDIKLAQYLGIKTIVIPNSLSLAAAAVMEHPPKNFLERKGILSVGAYDWQKGQDFVLKAYALSSAKNKIQLNFFGQKHTPFMESLQILASRLKLDPHFVHFHQGLDQAALFKHYVESQLFLYGSHTECQPLVLLDAMATGTPFISKKSGSIPFMQGGIAVQTEAEAGRVIDRLLEDQNEWSLLSTAGRNDARDHYSPDRVRNSLMIVLSQL